MSTRDDGDFSDEIGAHLALEADRLIADGLSPEQRREAVRRFGNVTLARERFHEASRWTLVEQLAQDLRYAGRTLAHNPAFAITTVLPRRRCAGMRERRCQGRDRSARSFYAHVWSGYGAKWAGSLQP